MKSPFTGGEVVLVSEQRKAVFRKEEYEYTHLFYRCVDSGEEFTTTEIDTFNYSQIYNSYRATHGIPYPDEIKALRERYALSASKMSKILGFGNNQYRLYEKGEMPSVAGGRVLKDIETPTIFEAFVETAKEALTPTEYARIKKRLGECEKGEPPTYKGVFICL